MENNHWALYCHINKKNNKKYFGITGQSVKSRWANGKGYKNCTKFQRAIDKYGWDNFKHEILYEKLSKEDAEKLEIYYINKNNSIKNGYNISYGGGLNFGVGKNIYQYSIDGYFIKEWSSISDILNYIGVYNGDSNIYSCIHGKIKYAYGYQWKDYKDDKIEKVETKSEMIKRTKRKPVYQYDSNGNFIKKYDFLTLTENDGFSSKRISSCCLGNSKTHKGFQWSYNYLKKIEKAIDPHILSSSKQSKTVYKYDDKLNIVTTYMSLSNASELNKMSIQLISNCCIRNKNNPKIFSKSRGFIWSYVKLN